MENELRGYTSTFGNHVGGDSQNPDGYEYRENEFRASENCWYINHAGRGGEDWEDKDWSGEDWADEDWGVDVNLRPSIRK